MTHSHSTYCNIIRGYIFENCRTFLFPSSFSSLFWGILMIMSILGPSTRTHDRTSKTYVVDSYLQFLYYLYVITVGTFFLLILTFSFLLYFFFRFTSTFFHEGYRYSLPHPLRLCPAYGVQLPPSISSPLVCGLYQSECTESTSFPNHHRHRSRR